MVALRPLVGPRSSVIRLKAGDWVLPFGSMLLANELQICPVGSLSEAA